jgi:outer membrane protein assembly factor BamA
LDRTGDIKFEANTELRFDILRLFGGAINLKGATFVDAGNIWLFKKSTDIVGGEFDPNYLWQDISMSGGVGLRFDFSFFVFRLDYAVKMKQPQLLEKSGWAFDQINYKNGVWNIAIGYPF